MHADSSVRVVQVQGEHKGFWFHTIGQRQGLGLSGGPWYVQSKDTDNNIVYITRNYHTQVSPLTYGFLCPRGVKYATRRGQRARGEDNRTTQSDSHV
jgi:hypothetical protein